MWLAVVSHVVACALAAQVSWAVAQRGRFSPESAYVTGGLLRLSVAFLNLWALGYLVIQHLRLGDTGRKLAHLEWQLHSGDTIVRDLSARLAAEE